MSNLISIQKHFSFEKANPGQLECIDKALTALELYDHVIIEAPTGIGKSEIAKCIHKVLADGPKRFRTTIITDSKMLQDQYLGEDRSIVDLKGKTNYPCVFHCGPYNGGGCRSKIVKKECDPFSYCEYVKQREIWKYSANLRMTNHSYQIEACPSLCMTPESVSDLIIIDECHEIEENILNHSIIKLEVEDYTIVNSLLQNKSFEQRIKKIIDVFYDRKVAVAFEPSEKEIKLIQSLRTEVRLLISKFQGLLGQSDLSNVFYGNAVETLQQIQDKLELFYRGKWIVNSIELEKTLELKPLDASYVADFALFRKAKKFIHMSSTICGKEVYCESLGIDPSTVKIIKVDNPIPEKNRIVTVFPKFKMSSKFEEYDKLSGVIDKIIERHEGQAGIIHSVSFKLAKDIFENSKLQDRLLISNNIEEIVEHLKNKGIVVSPSIEKGFDAKGDLSRFQIIPKIPFGYLGDPFIKLSSENNPNWYSRNAIIRLIQSCGRSIRGIDDYASTYILDKNVMNLLNFNKEFFPSWFLKSIRIVE